MAEKKIEGGMDREALKEFLSFIFKYKEPGEKIRFFALKDKKNIQKFFENISDFLDFLQENLPKYAQEGWNVYYNPAIFKKEAESGERSNVAGGCCLFCDIDFSKEGLSESEVVEKLRPFLEKLPLKPSAIVYSGQKGAHLYWFLDRRLEAEKFAEFLSLWVEYLHSLNPSIDLQCRNCNRLLRLPGSLHPKSGNYCKILELHPERIYAPRDFEEFVIPLRIEKIQQPIAEELIDEKQINVVGIVDVVKSYWNPGNRQNLALYLSGFLRKKGIRKEIAKAAIEKLCDITKDEEKDLRLKAVEYTYKKDKQELKGALGLREIFKSYGLSEDGAYYLISKLNNLVAPAVKIFEFEDFAIGVNPYSRKWQLSKNGEIIFVKRLPKTPKELKQALRDYLIALNDEKIRELFKEMRSVCKKPAEKKTKDEKEIEYIPLETLERLPESEWIKWLLKMKILKKETRKVNGESQYVFVVDRDGLFRYITEGIFGGHYFTLSDTEDFYVYEDGIYKKYEDARLRNLFYRILRKKGFRNLINEVTDRIIYSKVIERSQLKIPKNKVCLENCVLNLGTLETEPHSPEYHFFNKIPVKYDPEADCKNIKEDLQLSLPDERDRQAFFELVGYCLWPGNPFQKMFIFVGDGGEGKSRLIDLLVRFLGRQNCTSIPIQDLAADRNYCRATLFGKLLCFYSDISDKELNDFSFIKAITGEDTIKARSIYRPPFDFEFLGKCVYSANKPPRISEDNYAVWRRLLIFEFKQKIPPELRKSKEELKRRWFRDEELSGLLNEALKGLKRLFQNGRFSNERSVEEYRQLYLQRADSVWLFSQRCIEDADMTEYIPKNILYSKYLSYCSERGLKPVGEKVFRELFLKYKAVPYERLSSGKNKGQYAFFGIKVVKKKAPSGEESEKSEGCSQKLPIYKRDLQFSEKSFTNFTNFTAQQSDTTSTTTSTTFTTYKEETPQQEKEPSPADLEPEIESCLIKMPGFPKVSVKKAYENAKKEVQENCRRKGISFDKKAFDTAFKSVWNRHRKGFIYAPNCPEEYKADSPEGTLVKIAQKYIDEYPEEYAYSGIPERELKKELKKAFQGPPEKWIEHFKKVNLLYECKDGYWKVVEI